MLKKMIIGTCLLVFGFNPLKAEPLLEVPSKFFVKQHWFSLTNTFDIETNDRKFGTVHRKLLSLTPQYLFFDVNNELHAKAKMRFFRLGATFDIFDMNDQPMGKVDEQIFTFFPTFDFYRADGYLAAEAKLNFWGTKYTVKDPQTQEVIAYLWRSFFRLKDDWSVDIVNPSHFFEKQIDPRMFILVMVFQTDRDYWSQFRYSTSNSRTAFKDVERDDSHEFLAINQALNHYKTILEAQRDQFSSDDLNESETESLEVIIEKRLNDAEICVERSTESLQLAKAKSVERGIFLLMPLLHSDELTFGQKSALYHLMLQKLTD